MTGSDADNKRIISEVIDKAINQGRLDVVADYFSADLVEHDPHQAPSEDPIEAFTAAVEAFRTAFPDSRMAVEDQIAEAGRVATRWRMTGSHGGVFMGIEPTGKPVDITGIFFDRLENGRIVETWANYDLHGLLQQLGD
jgi:steroid delta-isomerase-like uncharacterized protein